MPHQRLCELSDVYERALVKKLSLHCYQLIDCFSYNSFLLLILSRYCKCILMNTDNCLKYCYRKLLRQWSNNHCSIFHVVTTVCNTGNPEKEALWYCFYSIKILHNITKTHLYFSEWHHWVVPWPPCAPQVLRDGGRPPQCQARLLLRPLRLAHV